MEKEMKRVLITGAAGFIGYHLAEALHARGDLVVGLDNFNDYYPSSLKHDRAKQLSLKGVEVIKGDVCDGSLLQKLIEKHKITHIVHMAAQAGVRYSLENPQAYVDANVTGFLSVLEACRKYPHIPLTYASSSSVYGTNTKIPFSVEDRTDHQASFYGVTKKMNELMAQTYCHLYGVHATGLRFFTVYGPWGRPDMACYLFAKAILEEKPIDVYNHGNMQRDFTYIDDIVEGSVSAIDLAAENEIFNLGNHRPEPISALIKCLEDSLGKKANLHHLPMQPGDVKSTYADISRSKEKLGFSPKTSLDEGVKKFVNWYQDYLTNESKVLPC